MPDMQEPSFPTAFKVLHVTSAAFRDKGNIPREYTCDGKDINPPLEIKAIPPEAKSIALIFEDPDAPSGTWLHWLVWNIPIMQHIRANEVPGEQGMNDFGRNDYGGPCPPSGTHRYIFKVYALDDLIDLTEGSTRNQLEDAMRDHIVAYGELQGFYKRPGENNE
ncbi:MAG TPA: YbhB/YbcL family Raf kinase inhibitor-like protein [Chryseolinea sp.]